MFFFFFLHGLVEVNNNNPAYKIPWWLGCLCRQPTRVWNSAKQFATRWNKFIKMKCWTETTSTLLALTQRQWLSTKGLSERPLVKSLLIGWVEGSVIAPTGLVAHSVWNMAACVCFIWAMCSVNEHLLTLLTPDRDWLILMPLTTTDTNSTQEFISLLPLLAKIQLLPQRWWLYLFIPHSPSLIIILYYIWAVVFKC